MDQEHAKFILATGFRHFWRGKAQKERMSVLACAVFKECDSFHNRENFLGEGIFNRDDEVILNDSVHDL